MYRIGDKFISVKVQNLQYIVLSWSLQCNFFKTCQAKCYIKDLTQIEEIKHIFGNCTSN